LLHASRFCGTFSSSFFVFLLHYMIFLHPGTLVSSEHSVSGVSGMEYWLCISFGLWFGFLAVCEVGAWFGEAPGHGPGFSCMGFLISGVEMHDR
jgi:hypothetical protein